MCVFGFIIRIYIYIYIYIYTHTYITRIRWIVTDETLALLGNFPSRMFHEIISWHFKSVKPTVLLSNFIQWFRVPVGKTVPQAWQLLCVLSRPFRCSKPKLFQPLLYSSPTCSIMLDRRGFETDVHLSLRIRLTAMQLSSFQKCITLSTMPVNYWLFLDYNVAWVWTREKPDTSQLNKSVLQIENVCTTDFFVIHVSLKS